MHAAGAAVDDFLHADSRGRRQHVARALDVDLVVVLLGHVELAKGRRQVMDDVDALHRARDDVAVRDGAENDLRAAAFQLGRGEAFLVVQHHDGVTVGE